MLTAPSAAAARTSPLGTTSGISACQGGMLIACPHPIRKVRPSRTCGEMSPSAVTTVRTPPTTRVPSCSPTRSRRRSKESASTPAGSASSSIGSRLAVCTSETRVAASGSSISNHWAPTVCIQVPIMLASCASQSAR